MKIPPLNARTCPQGYFEDNPTDLAALRRDKALHTVKVQHHLAHVPDYLLPAALRNEETVEDGQETAAAPAPQKKRKQPGNYGSAKRRKYQVSGFLMFLFMYRIDRVVSYILFMLSRNSKRSFCFSLICYGRAMLQHIQTSWIEMIPQQQYEFFRCF